MMTRYSGRFTCCSVSKSSAAILAALAGSKPALLELVDRDLVVHEVRHQQTIALGVVPDVRRGVHVVEHGLERPGRRTAIDRLPVPAGHEERSIIEKHQSVETSLRKSSDVGLLAVIDLI